MVVLSDLPGPGPTERGSPRCLSTQGHPDVAIPGLELRNGRAEDAALFIRFCVASVILLKENRRHFQAPGRSIYALADISNIIGRLAAGLVWPCACPMIAGDIAAIVPEGIASGVVATL